MAGGGGQDWDSPRGTGRENNAGNWDGRGGGERRQ